MHATGEAPGKIILMGEHAVVYGIPALAVPVGHRMCVDVGWSPGSGMEVDAPDVDPDDQETRASLERGLSYCVTLLGVRPGRTHFRLTSDIPLGKGMGSSAALSVAALRALAALEDRVVAPPELARLANQVEAIFHGTPSGLDAAVIAHGRPLLFTRGSPPRTEPLSSGATLWAVLVDTGAVGNTARLVAGVRALRDAEPARVDAIFSQIKKGVIEGIDVLRRGDVAALGPLLSANHHLLRALGVSTPTLDKVVQVSLDAGALGAKLTGAGGGGLALALVADPSAAAPVIAAIEAMGLRAWSVALA